MHWQTPAAVIAKNHDHSDQEVCHPSQPLLTRNVSVDGLKLVLSQC
jgi:hypothetical protein